MIRIAQPSARLVDPHDCTDSADDLSILHSVFDTLVRRKPIGFGGQLAETWRMSHDCRRFEMRLRRGATFSDETPVDAEAVCANLRRMARPDKGYALGSPGVWHQYLGGAEIVPTGALDVRIDLAEPVADLLDILSQAFIAAPSGFHALDAGDVAAAPGSGAYIVERVEGGIVRVAPRAGGKGPDAVEWHEVAAREDRLTALLDGRAEIAMRLPFGVDLPEGMQDDAYDVPTAIIFMFNQRRGPLQDTRLRKALHWAVNRPGLVREVRGGAGKALYHVVDHHGIWVRSGGWLHSRERTRQLMEEAGYGDGLHLTVDIPTRLPDEAEPLTEAVAAQLAPLGITLDIRRHADREAYAHMVRRKEIGDMCLFDSSPLSTFRVFHEKLDSRVAGAWWQGHASPELEALLDRARRTAADHDRRMLYSEACRLTYDDPPWLPLYTHRRRIGCAAGVGLPHILPGGILDTRQMVSKHPT